MIKTPFWLASLLVAAAALLAAPTPAARACDMNVREAGFIESDGSTYRPRPYELWLVCEKSGPEDKAWVETVEKLCTVEAEGVNLVPSVLSLAEFKPEQVKELQDLGVDLKSLPLTVAVRQGFNNVELVASLPGRADAATVRGLFESPKKDELKKLLSDFGNYCVFLFSPGSDEPAGQAALKAVEAAAAAHLKARPAQKTPILRLDRADNAETFLRSELGLEADGAKPVLVVVFGLGCQMVHRFEGEDIAPENLAECLDFLNHNASDCTPDSVFVRSGDTRELLMQWEPELADRLAVEANKVAAENLARLFEEQEKAASDGTEPGGSQPAGTSPAAGPRAAKAAPMRAVLFTAAGALLAVALGIVVWMLFRKRPDA